MTLTELIRGTRLVSDRNNPIGHARAVFDHALGDLFKAEGLKLNIHDVYSASRRPEHVIHDGVHHLVFDHALCEYCNILNAILEVEKQPDMSVAVLQRALAEVSRSAGNLKPYGFFVKRASEVKMAAPAPPFQPARAEHKEDRMKWSVRAATRPTLVTLVGLLVGARSIRTYDRLRPVKPLGVVVEPAKVVVSETADPLTALAALTDFKKLATLDPAKRAINPRLKKILYWLYVADAKGIGTEDALKAAFNQNSNAGTKASNAIRQTITNYRTAKLWGLFTTESLAKLKRGEAVQITRGSYVGQFVEIDHIVPLARYPQHGNDLANLQILPQAENRRKGEAALIRIQIIECFQLKSRGSIRTGHQGR